MIPSLPTRAVGRTNLRITALGLGLAPLGNLYRRIGERQARDTIYTALELGIRYFDTAPYYGFGLSERRSGDALRGNSEIAISTKAGRLLTPSIAADTGLERHGFVSPMPFEPIFDYSYEGILRSHEQSLQRMGLARIDILLVHDIGKQTHGAAHEKRLDELVARGGLKALCRLREEGAVSAIGLGVNEIEICLELLEQARLDLILLAGRYTLLEQGGIDRLLPKCADDGVSIVIGGPFNSGILATGASASEGARYNYAPASKHVRERVNRLEAICAAHRVPLAAAALQFPLAHPSVASVIPGFASAAELRLGVTHFQTPIPTDLWRELRNEGLIDPRAPVPSSGPLVEAAS
jgi:D-threo-aldose 1-dehydrogenase